MPAGSDIIRIGLIGCGNRGPGAVVNAMTVDPGVTPGGHGRHLCRPCANRAANCCRMRSRTRCRWTTPIVFPAWTATNTSSKAATSCSLPARRSFIPSILLAGSRGRQARVRREAARHRSGRRPQGHGRLRVGKAKETERYVRASTADTIRPIEEPMQARPRRGDRRDRGHRGDTSTAVPTTSSAAIPSSMKSSSSSAPRCTSPGFPATT